MRHSSRTRAYAGAVGAMVMALTAVAAFAGSGSAATPGNTDVTFVIDRVHQLQSPDSNSSADFYAKVNIDGQGLDTGPRAPDDTGDVSPHWAFTRTVPISQRSVSISVEIWDHDDTFNGGDDITDISPIDHKYAFDLTYDLVNRTWSTTEPHVPKPSPTLQSGYVEGDGDTEWGNNDGAQSEMWFHITRDGEVDTDGDGIPDQVELNGIRDANGNMVTDLAAMGADPCRKDVAIKVDYMETTGAGHTHKPTAAALKTATDAFDQAPVPATTPCPYGGYPKKATGIGLLLDVNNAVPEAEVLDMNGVEYGLFRFVSLSEWERPFMHYMVFAHDQAKDSSSSGLSCRDGKDFLVSLGHWSGSVGTDDDQAGSLMHELGHCLGLGHGGADGINCKPNYLSIMNYRFQTIGVPTGPASSRFSYSLSALPALNEANLDESKGIGDGTDITTWTPDGTKILTGIGNAPIDWNGNGKIDPVDPANPEKVDVNDFVDTGGCGNDATKDKNLTPSPGEMLNGYDDWSNLHFGTAYAVLGGGDTGHTGDIDFPQSQILKADYAATLGPDLSTSTIIDKPNSTPGDTLTFTTTITNVGPGTAFNVTLDETPPGGSKATVAVADLAPGASTTKAFTATVPFPTADLTVLTGTATVHGTDHLGTPEQHPSNDTSSASTTVHTPVMTLSKTGTASVAAGDAITYTLTYANTGSGAAANVVITDVVPADVYYSLALDTGAGPKPNSVTVNANGTTTLRWTIGAVPATSGNSTIVFTARPTLLALSGTGLTNTASLDYRDINANQYPTKNASASSTVAATPITKDPLSQGYWQNHPAEWTPEVLARIAATDSRFDGADGTTPNGALSAAEVTAVFKATGQPGTLRSQLLAVYFNLATHRITAGTLITGKVPTSLALTNVRDAALYARATLALPSSPANATRIDNATSVLGDINLNKSEKY